MADCSDLRCWFCSGEDGYDAKLDFGEAGTVIVFSCLECARLGGAFIQI
jgi:hypothetical protein